MLPEIKYRKAIESDLPQIYFFEQEYIKEIEPEDLEKWLKAEKKIKAQITKSMGKSFTAEVDSEMIGHCFWDFYEDEPHIYSIYVSKAHRRKGVAIKLLALAEADIYANGLRICKLSTRSHNPAKELFEALGYKFTGQKKNWLSFEKQL